MSHGKNPKIICYEPRRFRALVSVGSFSDRFRVVSDCFRIVLHSLDNVFMFVSVVVVATFSS